MDPKTTFRPEYDADVALSRPGGLSFPIRSRRACDPRLDIAHLLEQIESEVVRASVCSIFSSLLRLLDNLSVLEKLKEGPLTDDTKLALHHFRCDADSLVGRRDHQSRLAEEADREQSPVALSYEGLARGYERQGPDHLRDHGSGYVAPMPGAVRVSGRCRFWRSGDRLDAAVPDEASAEGRRPGRGNGHHPDQFQD